tara:strand:+ start:422 stop:766 length:345 start_codon:yes stop_codon:yes gene_type:complete
MNLDAKNILYKWIDFVSSQNLKSVINLYAKEAILLGTFAKKINITTDDIELYFIDFFKKKPIASFLDLHCISLQEDCVVFNGNYLFNASDGLKVNVRFTFVLKKYDSWKIISHH